MSHLCVSESSKEDAKWAYETPERPDGKQKRKNNGMRCYRCGSSGHLARDLKCPARGQTCRKCKRKNHFASVYKTKPKNRRVKVTVYLQGWLASKQCVASSLNCRYPSPISNYSLQSWLFNYTNKFEIKWNVEFFTTCKSERPNHFFKATS